MSCTRNRSSTAADRHRRPPDAGRPPRRGRPRRLLPATGTAADLQPLRRGPPQRGGPPPGSDAVSFMTGCPEALGEEPLRAIEALAAAGVSRIVVPAEAFAADPDELLGRFGERVIGALR
ncbi:MAG: hypothetical protein R2755_18565 [Acidimicrobiales bacterium]